MSQRLTIKKEDFDKVELELGVIMGKVKPLSDEQAKMMSHYLIAGENNGNDSNGSDTVINDFLEKQYGSYVSTNLSNKVNEQ